MLPARVSRLNVTPVKSFRLQHPNAVWLDRTGVAEDRRFVLVDDRGRLYNACRDALLVLAEARWDPGSRKLEVTLPAAGTLAGEARRGGATVVEIYGRPVRGHFVEGPWSDALSDAAARSLRLVEREHGTWATDVRPVTIVSQASLDLIDGDGRRFRMLIEVEGLEALGEETWRKRRLRVGEATLLVGGRTPRCAASAAHPDTGRRDRDVLRELIDARSAERGGRVSLGVYADVLEPGLVRVGDSVELCPDGMRPSARLADRVRVSRRRLPGLRTRSVS